MAFSDPGKDRKVINSNTGPEAPQVILAEDCRRGDVLGYDSGWKRALATAGSVVQGRFVALQDGFSGRSVPVASSPVISGYAEAVPGGYVYVAEGADYGKITQSEPDTSGDANTIIGIALSTDTVRFFLNARPDSTV